MGYYRISKFEEMWIEIGRCSISLSYAGGLGHWLYFYCSDTWKIFVEDNCISRGIQRAKWDAFTSILSKIDQSVVMSEPFESLHWCTTDLSPHSARNVIPKVLLKTRKILTHFFPNQDFSLNVALRDLLGVSSLSGSGVVWMLSWLRLRDSSSPSFDSASVSPWKFQESR